MSVIRVYLPGRAADLSTLVTARQVDITGRIAYAVTPDLIASTPRADRDEREHVAFSEAVGLAADLADGTRSLVIAADVPEVDATQRGALTVELTGVLQLRQIASFHVGEDDGDSEPDMLWYDATELASVQALLVAGSH
ncbi:MAG: hypothetical protein V9G19_14595 [Tetrasphaera sp.]